MTDTAVLVYPVYNKIVASFGKFLKKYPNTIGVILIVISLIGAVVIYWVQGVSTQNALAEQMLHREQVVARSGANSMGYFLANIGRNITVFSTREEIVAADYGASLASLQKVIKVWAGTPLEAMVITDKNGIIKIDLSQTSSPDLGADVSDREYFLWAKNAAKGEYYIGDPIVSRLGATEGTYVIPVATPIFNQKNEFNGVLVAIIPLDRLAEKFISPLKISDKTDVYIIDAVGNLVYLSATEYLGKNIIDLTNEINFKGNGAVAEMFKGEFAKPGTEGKLDISFPNLNHGGVVVRNLLAYSGVNTGGSGMPAWYLIIATPAEDAFLYTGVFYTDQIVSLIYFVIVILAISCYAITYTRLRGGWGK